MSVREYDLNFTKLSKYDPSLVVDPSPRMNKFMSRVSNLVVKECRTSMFVKDMEPCRAIEGGVHRTPPHLKIYWRLEFGVNFTSRVYEQ